VPSASSTNSVQSTSTSITTSHANAPKPTSSSADTLRQEEQKVAERISELSTQMAGLRSEKDHYEAQGTKEDHDKAMSILEQLQNLERSYQENVFKQKQINQQLQQATNQQPETAGLQKQTSIQTLKLALRLR